MASRLPELACPRCGYDVSGVVPTWTERCPLEGRCSECGLGLEWADLFRPERIAPAWSFEHARKRRARTFAGTLFRTFRPGVLWRKMRLAAPVRIGRLLILAITAVVIAHLTVAGVSIKLFEPWLWRSGTVMRGGILVSTTPMFAWDKFWSIVAWPYSHEWSRLIGPLGLLLLVWGVLAPLPFLVLGQTMAAAKVRRAHLFRGWVYFLPPVCLVGLADVAMMALPLMYFNRFGVYGLWGWMRVLWIALGVLLFVGAVVWLLRWWGLFTRLYLQIPRPHRVTVVMSAISFLAALVICLLTDVEMRYAIGTPLNWLLEWRP